MYYFFTFSSKEG